MMRLQVYLITLAKNAGEAKSEVEMWIGDHADRYFYDYGELEKPEKAVLVSTIRGELEKAKAETEAQLPIIEKNIMKHKITGDRGMEGYYHKQYGEILTEGLTGDMPFFNITEWDWSLPAEIPEDRKGCRWYAVRADLHS
jgi:hypothetical protein